MANGKKPQARREIGAELPDSGRAGEPPAFGFHPIRQLRCRGGIPCPEIAHDLVEIAVCVGREPRKRHPSDARPVARAQSRKNLVRFDQFSSIRLADAVLDITNQFFAAQRAHIFSLLDPFRECEPIVRRQLCGFALELLDGHGQKMPEPRGAGNGELPTRADRDGFIARAEF